MEVIATTMETNVLLLFDTGSDLVKGTDVIVSDVLSAVFSNDGGRGEGER